MPSHHGVGLDEHERRAPVPPRLAQYDSKQPISPPQLRTGACASQRVELLAEREVLEDQFVMSAEGQHEPADEDEDDLKHASILSVYRQRCNQSRRTVLVLAKDRVQFWVQSERLSERCARKLLKGLAPQAGFEPATLRLTG
jgi:hypothetical protein